MSSLWGPLGHLAFDRAGVDPVAAGADLFLAHLRQQGFVPVGQRLGGARVAFGEAALEDLQAAEERQAVH